MTTVFIPVERPSVHKHKAVPEQLDDAAYYGLAGDVVKTLDPHTEADPVAVLLQFLVAFGSFVGLRPYYQVEGDRHKGNLFALIVGESSKARKGTALGRVKQLYGLIEDPWINNCISSGLSSGEGLIYQVRDAIAKGGDITDEGVQDKRLMVIESEFASLLRVMGREGNTISPVIRQLWDSDKARTSTRNNPLKATGAHVSIIGHCTVEELRRYLTQTETANGFANRFLFVCAKRSKRLPFGGSLDEKDLQPLAKRLADAIGFAKNVDQMQMDERARGVWAKVYNELSEGFTGILGAVTSRAEAQTVRLAMLYALLDQHDKIGAEHLNAALALWGYTENCARYVFGDSLGIPVADEILRSLRANGKTTRTEISNLFGRNKKAEEISHALGVLEQLGVARFYHQQIHGEPGRPVELWEAV
jgi:hypothetical protein